MPLYRVDTVFPMFTGQPEDIVMNTLHFESTQDDPELMVQNAEALLNPFWTTIYGAPAAGRVNWIDWPAMKYRLFDLSAPSPRVPYEAPGPFADAGTLSSIVPTEVAVVASFQSAGLPGERYQRRYNRIYVGCLPSTALSSSSSSSFPILNSPFRQACIDAMVDLQAAAPGPSTLWVQVSTAGGTTRTLPVIGGWVDNSPDTQRRRSVESTSRLTWQIP